MEIAVQRISRTGAWFYGASQEMPEVPIYANENAGESYRRRNCGAERQRKNSNALKSLSQLKWLAAYAASRFFQLCRRRYRCPPPAWPPPPPWKPPPPPPPPPP